MAKSKFEYVKSFEQHFTLLKNTYIVVRIDGHSFHRFTAVHKFQKPNDVRNMHLMNEAAKVVLQEFDDIFLAYGQSDEFSFAFRRDSTRYGRRSDKISTNVVSLFTAAYVKNWNVHFAGLDLEIIPSFDARCVVYPSFQNLRDYFSWRQADCHINNLYNTAFWELIQNPTSNLSETAAQEVLKTTDSAAKNELLFNFGVNYNNLPDMYRKGSVLSRDSIQMKELSKATGTEIERKRNVITICHSDIIRDTFWSDRELNKM